MTSQSTKSADSVRFILFKSTARTVRESAPGSPSDLFSSSDAEIDVASSAQDSIQALRETAILNGVWE